MVTRRSFLSTTATLAAASQLAPHAFAAPTKPKLGYALVGLGRLSTNQIAPALQKSEHSELVAIVTGVAGEGGKVAGTVRDRQSRHLQLSEF